MRPNHLLLILFAITSGCVETTEPRSGTIALMVKAFGGDVDNSYDVHVNSSIITIPANTSVNIYREPGDYTILVESVADNCVLSGTNPRGVTLDNKQTVHLEYAVDCAVTGVEVRTRTTGDFTPSNYMLVMDGHAAGSVSVNGSTLLTRIIKGSHTMRLVLPGTNCANVLDDTLTVEIVNRTVIVVTFDIVCHPPVRRERIAFVRNTVEFNAFEQLALADPDGSNIVVLGAGNSPSWSPDGSRLVFSTYNCDFYYGCSGELKIVDPEVAQITLLGNKLNAVTPSWSPSGDVIAFIDQTTDALHLVDPFSPNANHAVPVDGAQRVRDPAWSPDGTRIVAGCVIATSNFDVCTFDRDGKKVLRLTSDIGAEVEPAWSPDGRLIAFTSSLVIGGDQSIFVMASDGTAQRKLTTGFSPAWSRDGSKIIFARFDGLFTIRPDGSELSQLTTGRDYGPAWRP